MFLEAIVDQAGQSIQIGTLTVLIGPNNAGKSRTLQEISARYMGGSGARINILRDVVIKLPTVFDELISDLSVENHPTQSNTSFVIGMAENLTSVHREHIDLSHLKRGFEMGGINKENACRQIGRFWIGYLNPEVRINIANEGPINTPEQVPANLLAALYAAGPSVVSELEKVFSDIFSKHIFLDYGQIPNVCLRVSDTPVTPPDHPQKLHEFAKNYPKLHEQGHGYRSLVGVVLSVLLARKRCILLDEPEAFLHPFQARTLGRWLGERAKVSKAQIVIATQNPSFVNGLLSASDEVDFLRLNRMGNVTSFHRLDKKTLSEVIRSPILASQRVTEALFHSGAIVCEADTDRLFYQAVADSVNPNTSWFFLHAHNKQTIHQVVKLLRTAGIPVRAIADIDLLNDLTELRRCVESFGAPLNEDIVSLLKEVEKIIGSQPEDELLAKLKADVVELKDQLDRNQHRLGGARGALGRIAREATRWAKIKDLGISAYDGVVKNQLTKIIDNLNKVGLFLVPIGELESWLEVGKIRKNEWIVPALESIQKNGCPKQLAEFMSAVTK